MRSIASKSYIGHNRTGAAHEPLHDTGSHGAPRRVKLVSLEAFLGQCEGRLADIGGTTIVIQSSRARS